MLAQLKSIIIPRVALIIQIMGFRVLPPPDGMNYPTTNMLVRRPQKRRKYYVARLHLRGRCPDQSAEGEIRWNADEDGRRRKRGKKGGILEEKDDYAKPFMRVSIKCMSPTPFVTFIPSSERIKKWEQQKEVKTSALHEIMSNKEDGIRSETRKK
jgi:hypothetical protein